MSDSVNPNVEVGAEATITSKSNSAVSFDELDQMDDQQAKPKREPKAEKPEKKSEAKPAAKESPDKGGKERKKEAEEDDEEAAPRSAKPKESEGEDKEPKDSEDRPKQKPKVHKFRHGDEEHAISGESVVSVSINGKKEEVPLQELVNNYSGKVHYDREFSKLDVERKEFKGQVDSLNTMVQSLFERSQQNPEDAYDFLAEMTGQDSVQLKEKILRAQWEAMKHLAELPDDDREEWFKDQVRNWRDRKYEYREEREKAEKAKVQERQMLQQAMQEHGITEDAYTEAKAVAKKYLKGEEPTPQQVIYAERYMTAVETIKEHVPHLVGHAQFGSIVGDIVSEMMAHPKLFGKDRLPALLKETFPEEDQPLSALARKAKKAAELDGDELKEPKRASRREALTFDDID